jgi:hypothetical protein
MKRDRKEVFLTRRLSRKPNPFLFMQYTTRLATYTKTKKASSGFVTDLSSGTSIKRGVSLFKHVILYTVCSALLYLRNPHHGGLLEDLFDCGTHSRDRTNNEAHQIACSRRVMIWMNGLFLMTASTLVTVASWPE